MIRASALKRILECPGSEALPHTDNVSTGYSEFGDAMHEAAEGKEVTGEHAKAATELQAALVGFLPDDAEQEVSFAYCVATGKARRIGRPYSEWGLGAFEVPMTVDVWAPGCVWDLKSGWADLGPVDENPQLLIAALANAALFERDEIAVGIVDIRNPGDPSLTECTVDLIDLEVFRGRVHHGLVESAKQVGRAEYGDGQPHVVEGDHCRYCPAITNCPAKQSLIASMTDDDDERSLPATVELSWAGGLTAENAPAAYQTWKRMQLLTKRVGEIIHAYAKQNPIELGEGRVFGPREKKGNERLDGNVAWHTIRRMYGIEIAEKACKFSATKKDIKAALKEANPGKSLAAAEKELLEEIRSQGGAERKTTTKIEEYTR